MNQITLENSETGPQQNYKTKWGCRLQYCSGKCMYSSTQKQGTFSIWFSANNCMPLMVFLLFGRGQYHNSNAFIQERPLVSLLLFWIWILGTPLSPLVQLFFFCTSFFAVCVGALSWILALFALCWVTIKKTHLDNKQNHFLCQIL